jgi:molecular chaperone GrpE
MANKSSKTAELEQQVGELTENWKRAVADYQNLQKRVEIQQANYIKLASVQILQKLIPILDDLERASEHIKDTGLQMITKQLYELLAEEGVVRLEPLGSEFDPHTMECVETSKGKKNIVTRVQTNGYVMGDIVLRAAKVEVGSGK